MQSITNNSIVSNLKVYYYRIVGTLLAEIARV